MTRLLFKKLCFPALFLMLSSPALLWAGDDSGLPTTGQNQAKDASEAQRVNMREMIAREIMPPLTPEEKRLIKKTPPSQALTVIGQPEQPPVMETPPEKETKTQSNSSAESIAVTREQTKSNPTEERSTAVSVEAVSIKPAVRKPALPNTVRPSAAVTGGDDDRVARAVFSKHIENKEPSGSLQQASPSLEEVYFFTELRGMKGEKATHRWSFNHKTISEITFDIDGPRWRIWSKKTLFEKKPGIWTAAVINEAGEVLTEHTLTVTESSTAVSN